MLHRLQDLDTAVSLAVLQEEALALSREELDRPPVGPPVRSETTFVPRSSTCQAFPLPPPPLPSRATPMLPPALPDDKHVPSSARPSVGTDEKLRSMKAYR